ncbi:MAG: pyridoxal phosphate-dependent aminotransferase [Deferribacteraceae bacterium]|jgi:cystathionine beta-lyase|nr:pyridoxal phosphate-dependent aminotransferase [Deferribacteraceae bacterium]
MGSREGRGQPVYNFDEKIDNSKLWGIRYDFRRISPFLTQESVYQDIIPLWVADMDFRTPEEVSAALIQSARHGVFGYTEPNGSYFNAVLAWHSRRYGFDFSRESMTVSPGVVFSIALSIDAYTQEGDAVLIQEPVYPPFSEVPRQKGRKVVVNELILVDGEYRIDFERFEAQIRDEKVRLFILCSPHNPVGRVWTAEELHKLGEISLKYGVIVVSDEIHADFVFTQASGGRIPRHTIFVSVDKRFQENTITLTAPSKTFNLAGLQASSAFISDKELRSAFVNAYKRSGYSQLNCAGLFAAYAAYTYGDRWLTELVSYLEGNIRYLSSALDKAPIDLIKPEGTYLLWLDCRKLRLNDRELKRFFIEKAGVWLHSGGVFGDSGKGFMRINIAVPRSVIKEAAERINKSAGDL